jgi:hypothetical protein
VEVVLLDNLDGRLWHVRDDADQDIPLRQQFGWVKCDVQDESNYIHGIEAVATSTTIPLADSEALCWACWPSYWDSPRAEMDARGLDETLALALAVLDDQEAIAEMASQLYPVAVQL